MGGRLNQLFFKEVINNGDCIELTDGSRWRVRLDGFPIDATWQVNDQISLVEGVDKLFPTRLINMDTRSPDFVSVSKE